MSTQFAGGLGVRVTNHITRVLAGGDGGKRTRTPSTTLDSTTYAKDLRPDFRTQLANSPNPCRSGLDRSKNIERGRGKEDE